MASAVIPPRQLAPTVGQVEALAGVLIRTGSVIHSDTRVLSGLVVKFGEMEFVSDNAGCFRGRPFPANGCVIEFGAFATEFVCEYPEQVLVAEDPPAVCAARGRRTTRPESCAVMMAGVTAPPAEEPVIAPVERSTRRAKQALERQVQPGAETSRAPVRTEPLRETVERLNVPGAAELEAERLSLLEEAEQLAEVRRDFDRVMREYDAAHGLSPVGGRPNREAEVRRRGKGLNAEIDRDGRAASSVTPSVMSAARPNYSSPAKTLRAAEAARAELSGLTGEARRKQQDRVNELVEVATRQNEAFKRANTAAGGSQVVHSARAASNRSRGQASSPHVGGNQNQSRNPGGNQQMQMQTYDPAYAGKQIAEQGNVGQAQSRSRQAPSNRNVGNANSIGRGHPPRYPVPNQAPRRQVVGAMPQRPVGGQDVSRYDDGNSAMAKAGYHAYESALGS